MTLKMYFKPLIEYWWLLISAAIVAMATTFMVTYSQPLVYQTRATLVVGNMMYEANPSSNDMYLGQQLANYYARIGMQSEVRNSTQDALGLSWLPQYTINPLPNSQFIEVVVNDSNPARAQAVADELARQLISNSPTSNLQQGSDQQEFINEQASYLEEKIQETLSEIEVAERNLSETNSAQRIAELQAEIAALQDKLSQMQSNYAALISNTDQGAINVLSIIEPAAFPNSAIGPSKLMMVLIAGAVALMIAAVAAYFLEFLDDTIKTPEEIKKIVDAPFLGTISQIKMGGKGKKISLNTQERTLNKGLGHILQKTEESDQLAQAHSEDIEIYSSEFPQSQVSEEFRSLRFSLDYVSKGKQLHSILITSPSPAEGKSLVAANLASVMAQAGKKVVLLDLDFNQSSEDNGGTAAEEKGISDVLNGTMIVSDVMRPQQENLNIIHPGSRPANPIDFFSSEQMTEVLETLEVISDVVIIDGPSLMLTSSLALSSKVDGVVVVVRYGFTRRGTAETRLSKLSQVGAWLLGTVLNNAPSKRRSKN